ncbi:MAG: hypothetical protein J6S14_12310 [Clostridia bacterium]|nr:hypothetical protein [Clostridia bacterium]
MLNRMDAGRLDRAIKFMESGAFAHVGTETSDEVATILAVLYDYRREITRGERKQRVISQ